MNQHVQVRSDKTLHFNRPKYLEGSTWETFKAGEARVFPLDQFSALEEDAKKKGAVVEVVTPLAKPKVKAKPATRVSMVKPKLRAKPKKKK